MTQTCMHIMKKVNLNNLETQLALQCSPMLAGLKVSNLLIVPKHQTNQVLKLFVTTSVSARVIYRNKEKTIFLLYHAHLLWEYLQKPNVKHMMQTLGYESGSLEYILRVFSSRYTLFMEQKKGFPHEMGLLLGYPIEDVTSFIENNGKNCLYTGYWKVYNNLANCLHLFAQYDQVKEQMLRLIAVGKSIFELIDIQETKDCMVAG